MSDNEERNKGTKEGKNRLKIIKKKMKIKIILLKKNRIKNTFYVINFFISNFIWY